ncbi:MAG: response regulator PleD [Rickettsiales bacterium]|jgi:PAS domain S-box-containing protein|nr:response regulator PleD [Rickettsiales bacterium]
MVGGKLIAVSASRKNDAVVAIRQNNGEQDIEIQGLNTGAEKLLGYQNGELRGQSLFSILPPDVTEDLESYLDYEEAGNDIYAILGKMRNFKILTKPGMALPLVVKVFPIASQDSKNPSFELLLRDRTRKVFYDEVKDTLEANIDENIRLSAAPALEKILGLTVNHIHKLHTMESSVVVVMIDNPKAVLPEELLLRNELITAIGQRCIESCRTDDALVYLGQGRFGVVLFECPRDSAKTVANRICVSMAKAPFLLTGRKQVGLTVSVSYEEILEASAPASLIQRCNRVLDLHLEDGGNRVYNPEY